MTFRLNAKQFAKWKQSGKLDQVTNLPKRVPMWKKSKKASASKKGTR